MRYPFTSSLLVCVLASGSGCVRDRDNSGDARREIEETKDRAAQQRAKLEKKNDELAASGDDTSSERRRFAGETDRKLRELDEKITSLRGEVQARAIRAGGEQRGDLEAQLRDLDSARAEAQGALDSFRQEGARIHAGDPTARPVE